MSIYQMVQELSQNFNIVNRVPASINPVVCEESLRYIISSLVDSLAKGTANAEIRITAKCFHTLTLVQIKHKATQATLLNTALYLSVKNKVEELGGCMYATESALSGSTLSFTLLQRILPVAV